MRVIISFIFMIKIITTTVIIINVDTIIIDTNKFIIITISLSPSSSNIAVACTGGIPTNGGHEHWLEIYIGDEYPIKIVVLKKKKTPNNLGIQIKDVTPGVEKKWRSLFRESIRPCALLWYLHYHIMLAATFINIIINIITFITDVSSLGTVALSNTFKPRGTWKSVSFVAFIMLLCTVGALQFLAPSTSLLKVQCDIMRCANI